MNLHPYRLLLAGTAACLLFLAGCGGGGSVAGSTASTTASPGSGSGSSGSSSSGTGSTSSGGTGSTSGATTPAVTVASAARLLDQATFGPTTTDIASVQSLGINGWLAAQYALPQTSLAVIPSTLPAQCATTPTPCFESEFWQTELSAPDQLRQRVAFSLGELFVTSTQSETAFVMVPYYNTLAADAFSNWRTLMEDVTLSPAMGNYLNMIQSAKPPAGQHANENFAREMMQLFSTGLVKLNLDGTPQTDSTGNPVPEYTEAQVGAFADTYTGWTYASSTGTAPTKFPNYTANFYAPMQPVDSAHDTTQKTLLNGTVVPVGGTARGDLKLALDNLFNDPSLPPFVCRQLIQHLVTSTPSPAYVGRVATVFVNNGKGVRGDMPSVLTAIFTDTEARAGDTNTASDGGHLREPMLYLLSAMRALGYATTNTDPTNLYAYASLSGYTSPLSEQPMRSPSVFNFYPPEYVIPGTALNAPEFGLENTASVNLRLTLANTLSQGKLNGFSTNLSATGPLGILAANPGTLIDTLGVMLLHGQMPSAMRSVLVSAITGLTDNGQRVRVAVYLILSSSQYKVMH